MITIGWIIAGLFTLLVVAAGIGMLVYLYAEKEIFPLEMKKGNISIKLPPGFPFTSSDIDLLLEKLSELARRPRICGVQLDYTGGTNLVMTITLRVCRVQGEDIYEEVKVSPCGLIPGRVSRLEAESIIKRIEVKIEYLTLSLQSKRA